MVVYLSLLYLINFLSGSCPVNCVFWTGNFNNCLRQYIYKLYETSIIKYNVLNNIDLTKKILS